ncbi:MAG: helix-turn-helix domain-containing protein [Solirubrobacteraceae bacterium]|nr:helix-turn-helix domain-containing protein [Solirubrobacteraceae bacterium]
MAEIGAALREARSRARIEIAEMEAQTKIRAKYLRALENEEWDLLPGPTYVKSFLRTYGDMLGIDGRALVAEYKRTQETFTGPEDLGHFSKHTGGRTKRTEAPIRLYATIATGIVLVAAGAGYFLTRGGGDSGTPSADATPIVAVETPQPGDVVSVQITARKAVTVCARAGRRQVLRTTDLAAGERSPRLRSRSLLITASSGDILVRVNGDRVSIPEASGSLSFTVTENGASRESAATSACS